MENLRTPFGYDSLVGTEEKRHWPWYDMWAARSYTVAKMADKAEEHIRHMTACKSSLGALPEFVRLDGKRIGYYYTTPHGLFVSTLCEAMALIRNDDELLLGYGLTKNAGDFSCEGVCTRGGLKVSLEVKNASISYLRILNPTKKNVTIKLCPNPEFDSQGLDKEVSISACAEYIYGTK